MKLITISGVDGSGKSTQLSMLKDKLEAEGQKVFYFHAVEFSLANRLARKLKGKKEFTPGSEKATTKASWLSLQLRKVFLVIDILRFAPLKKKLAKQGFDVILSDRYFYDSIVNILYLSQKTSHNLWFERCIPHPDRAFYLDMSAEEILKRERVPEQGIEYLKTKIRLFQEKAAAWNMHTIPADQDKESVHQAILQILSHD